MSLEEDQARGRELLLAVELGLAVKQFLDSRVGVRLIADCEAKRAGLVDAFTELDPDDDAERRQMRALKVQIAALDTWRQFFTDYVTQGEHAEQEFQEREEVPSD